MRPSAIAAAILNQHPLELVAADKNYPQAHSSSVRNATHRVPVFRDGRFSGLVERSSLPPAITCNDAGEAELRCRLIEAINMQDWLDPDHVGVAVENHVVRLSGRGDSAHAVLTLRPLAASAPCVAAVIDELWVDYE